MHVVAEQRAVVGIGVEVEIAARGSELVLDCLQQLMPVGGEWIVVRPHFMNDFHPGIVAVGMDGDQPAARSERLGERRDHALGLEVER